MGMQKRVYTGIAEKLREWLKKPENAKSFAETWNGIAKGLQEATKGCTCEACVEEPVQP